MVLLGSLLVLSPLASAVTEVLFLNDYVVDISYDLSEVEAGETFYLDVTVTNEGVTREDVSVSLDLPSEFEEVGDDSKDLGTLAAGATKTVTFRVEVDSDTEDDDYEIELEIADSLGSDSDDFLVEVESERAELLIGDFTTLPGVISPNAEDVELKLTVENVGEKDAESAEVVVTLPQGFTPSFSNNNRFWLGRLDSGESKEISFFVDVDEMVASGTYDFVYVLTYEDVDDRDYVDREEIPFLVKSSPYLEVISSEGSGNVGGKGTLTITIQNTGDESAEAVDVRLLKQNSQPFHFDVRSTYVGELEPGETGVALFTIDATDEAQLRAYDFKVFIRAKGDSDTGDDTIYTFTRRAQYDIIGYGPNFLLYGGITLFFVLLFGVVLLGFTQRRRR